MATENTSTQNTSGSGFSQSPFGRLVDAVGSENVPGFPGGGGTESGGEGGNQFAGGGTPVSPFDQIRYNIDQAIYTAFPPGGGTPDANTSIDTSTINPFNQPPGGSSQSGTGNQFGGDDTQTGTGESPSFGGYNPFDPGFGGSISDRATQASNQFSGASTSSSSTVAEEPVLVTEVVTPTEDNIVIPTGEVTVVSDTTNQSDIINSGIDTSSVTTLNESVAGSSVTSSYPTQEEFLAIINGGDLNLPDSLSDDAKAYIQGQVSTIGGNIGQYQEINSGFANLSTDGSNPFGGASTPFGSSTNSFI